VDNLFDIKQKANSLRKEGKFQEALDCYLRIYPKYDDEFTIAGILHCLRKLDMNNKSMEYAIHLVNKKPDTDWAKSELKRAILTTVKVAKSKSDWKTVNELIVKIDVETLSEEPMKDKNGRLGWSDKSIWYHYRIRGLLEIQEFDHALEILNTIKNRFPRQQKFFLRLEALTNFRKGNLLEAEDLYSRIILRFYDWWILHEYACVLDLLGKSEKSLSLMSKAALMGPVNEVKISIIFDIGNLLKKMNENREALMHYVLVKKIREKQSWKINDKLSNTIDELMREFNDVPEMELYKLIDECKKIWKIYIPNEAKNIVTELKYKQNINGHVNAKGFEDKPYCYIKAQEGPSYFCYKSDLPKDFKDSCKVVFDAKQAFDKHGKESWKAKNVRFFLE
jgi:tetratricopeptide (TPR) repeat protein